MYLIPFIMLCLLSIFSVDVYSILSALQSARLFEIQTRPAAIED
jgi:hypothetical protein